MGQSTKKSKTTAKAILRGRCELCGKSFSKGSMTRHLMSCAPRQDSPDGERTRLFHLRVEALDPQYWLNLEAEAAATLADLDHLLRATWLECCGHLSAFEIDNCRYDVFVPDCLSHLQEQRNMEAELETLLEPGLQFEYSYDFGSLTKIKIRTLGVRPGCLVNPVEILARNLAPSWLCHLCSQPASRVCGGCRADGQEAFYCLKHAPEHRCSHLNLLPVVNSPRMGICAYHGS